MNNRKINKAKNWFFEKINKFDKSLARLMNRKGKKHKLPILGIRKEDISIDPEDI